VGLAERAVFVYLPSSCSLSCTGPGDGTLLEVFLFLFLLRYQNYTNVGATHFSAVQTDILPC